MLQRTSKGQQVPFAEGHTSELDQVVKGLCQECFEFYFKVFFKHQISSIWTSKPVLSVCDTKFKVNFCFLMGQAC